MCKSFYQIHYSDQRCTDTKNMNRSTGADIFVVAWCGRLPALRPQTRDRDRPGGGAPPSPPVHNDSSITRRHRGGGARCGYLQTPRGRGQVCLPADTEGAGPGVVTCRLRGGGARCVYLQTQRGRGQVWLPADTHAGVGRSRAALPELGVDGRLVDVEADPPGASRRDPEGVTVTRRCHGNRKMS